MKEVEMWKNGDKSKYGESEDGKDKNGDKGEKIKVKKRNNIIRNNKKESNETFSLFYSYF